MMLEAAVLTIMPGAVAFAAAMDIFTMRIPNRVSIVLVAAFFPLALLAGLGLSHYCRPPARAARSRADASSRRR